MREPVSAVSSNRDSSQEAPSLGEQSHPYGAFIRSATAHFGISPRNISSMPNHAGSRGAYGVARSLGASSVEGFSILVKLSKSEDDHGRVVAALIEIVENQRRDTSETFRFCELCKLTEAIVTGATLDASEQAIVAARGIRLDREYVPWQDEYQRMLKNALCSERWWMEVVDCVGIRRRVRFPNLDAIHLRLLRQLGNRLIAEQAAIDVVEAVLESGESVGLVIDRNGARELIAQCEYVRASVVTLAAEILRCSDPLKRANLIAEFGELIT